MRLFAAALRLSGLLRAVLAQGDGPLAQLDQALMKGLSARLAELRLALSAQPITLDHLPDRVGHGGWLGS